MSTVTVGICYYTKCYLPVYMYIYNSGGSLDVFPYVL